MIYVIDVFDPDTKQEIIRSIDRVYAKDEESAVGVFRTTSPFPTNWLVKAREAQDKRYG